MATDPQAAIMAEQNETLPGDDDSIDTIEARIDASALAAADQRFLARVLRWLTSITNSPRRQLHFPIDLTCRVL